MVIKRIVRDYLSFKINDLLKHYSLSHFTMFTSDKRTMNYRFEFVQCFLSIWSYLKEVSLN